MRWDLLFDDLESQLDQEQRDEERALAIEEERLRLSRLSLRDRLVAMAGLGRAGFEASAAEPVRVELAAGEVRALRPTGFGRDWVSGDLVEQIASRRRCVLPIDAIVAVLPSRRQLRESLAAPVGRGPALQDRIGVAFVLRDLSRRRAGVTLDTIDGLVHGTIDRVARDHLDVAQHAPDLPRRERDVQGYRLVPFTRLRLVAFE